MTRRFPVSMTEDGYRRLRRFAREAGLSEGRRHCLFFSEISPLSRATKAGASLAPVHFRTGDSQDMTLVAQHTQPCRLRLVLCFSYWSQEETADARSPQSATMRGASTPALRGPRGFCAGGQQPACLNRISHQRRNTSEQGKFVRFFLEKIRIGPTFKAKGPLGRGASGPVLLFRPGFSPAVHTPTI